MSEFIEQHLSSIWGSFRWKIKQHLRWVKKGLAYKMYVIEEHFVSRFDCSQLITVLGHVRTSVYRTPTFHWSFQQLQKSNSNVPKKGLC